MTNNKTRHGIMYHMISADESRYDHEASFRDNGIIDWNQYGKAGEKCVLPGDRVFIYYSNEMRYIRFECDVIKTSIPYDKKQSDKQYWKVEEPIDDSIVYMRLKPTRVLPPNTFTLDNLKDLGINPPQKRITVPGDALETILERFDEYGMPYPME